MKLYKVNFKIRKIQNINCHHHHPCQANFVHLNLKAPITMQGVIKSCAHVKEWETLNNDEINSLKMNKM